MTFCCAYMKEFTMTTGKWSLSTADTRKNGNVGENV